MRISSATITSTAALWLSAYLVVITTISIVRKAVTKEVRGEGLTHSNLAILKLEKREKVQGALGLVTTLASMYLFSVLGVRGYPNFTTYVVGAVGMATISVAALIEMFTLTYGESFGEELPTVSTEAPRRDLSGASDFRSDRRLSLGKVANDMAVASFV